MRTILAIAVCLSLTGCAYYLTQRPPIMERKLGRPGSESIGALATSADYRMVYVKLDRDAKMCAEPPPDAAGQFASLVTASLKSSKGTAPISAEMLNGMSVSMKQLFQRMQGVQLYRDGSFTYCNMFLNGVIDQPQYDQRMAELLATSAELVAQELKDRNEYPEFEVVSTPEHPSIPSGRGSETEEKPTKPIEAKPDGAEPEQAKPEEETGDGTKPPLG